MSNTNEPQTVTPGWGKRLKQARKMVGLTQATLGEPLGILNTAISKWEQENTEGIDARSLTAMEHHHGISKLWILNGEEPPIISTYDRADLRSFIDKLASARVVGAWFLPQSHGLAPMFEAGELVFWSEVKEPTQGAYLIVAPIGAANGGPGLAPEGCQIGQAFRSGGNGEWLLYRHEDRDQPGAYPAIRLSDVTVVGRVVARASKVDSTD